MSSRSAEYLLLLQELKATIVNVTELAVKLYEQGKSDGLPNKMIRADIEEALQGIIQERRLRQILPSPLKRAYNITSVNSAPSENQLKILERKCPSILEEIQKNIQDKTIRMQAITSPSEQFSRVLRNRDEIRNRNKLDDERNSEKNQILFLEGFKATQENDLKFLVYPKYVNFGYSSFIIFAISGVIFPLTYKWWPAYFLDNSEIFGLSAFGIGLILTFFYLGLELRNVFSNDSKPSRI
jgi:hypothetical protein